MTFPQRLFAAAAIALSMVAISCSAVYRAEADKPEFFDLASIFPSETQPVMAYVDHAGHCTVGQK